MRDIMICMDAEMNCTLVEASQWVESELICTSVEEKLWRVSKEKIESVTISRFDPLQSEDNVI